MPSRAQKLAVGTNGVSPSPPRSMLTGFDQDLRRRRDVAPLMSTAAQKLAIGHERKLDLLLRVDQPPL